MIRLCMLSVCLLTAGLLAAQAPVVVDKPLAAKCSKPRTAKVSHIMLHFCSYAIESPENPYQLDKILGVFEDFGVSAHYLIGRDGTIYRMVAEDRVAFHAGKGRLSHPPHHENSLNPVSLGIEMMAIGTEEEMKMFMPTDRYARIAKQHIGYTEAQYKALNWLLSDLMQRYQVPKDRQHIVGHDEYAPSRRTDPGSLFDWKKIGL